MPAPRAYNPELALSDGARCTMLPATARSALSSREFARETLDQWRLPSIYEVVLIVNELVTNAIIHSTGTIMLSLDLQPDAIRGLALVAALSMNWGIYERLGGKVIWADVALDRARPVYPEGPTI
jgi:hypothetical protein